MTIIGTREKVANLMTPNKVVEYVKELGNKGHFGDSETGVCVAVFGDIEVPPEIVAAIH